MSDGSGGLLDPLLARGPAAEAVGDDALLAALLRVEVALARVEASIGLVSGESAAEIEAVCRDSAPTAADLADGVAATGTPVAPMVAHLRSRLSADAASALHLGATSQDVMDTAVMLLAREALAAIVDDLAATASLLADLAKRHRATPMAARTLLQPALPTTFGLKAASWLAGLDQAAERLTWVRDQRLAVQLGGAAGTLASLGERGPAVTEALAAELSLAAPRLPWHTERSRVVDLAAALGLACSAVAKPALDLVLLSQAEVAEVADSVDRGGSSTLPQKRNPVAAVAARTCAMQAPGLVATLLAAASSHEHERGAGAWHAEWRPLAELLRSTGSAAAWLRDAVEHLEVRPERMRQNLLSHGGALLAERIAAAVAPSLGRAAAEVEVAAAVRESAEAGSPLAQALLARPALAGVLDPGRLDDLLDPSGYLGRAELLVNRALKARTLP